MYTRRCRWSFSRLSCDARAWLVLSSAVLLHCATIRLLIISCGTSSWVGSINRGSVLFDTFPSFFFSSPSFIAGGLHAVWLSVFEYRASGFAEACTQARCAIPGNPTYRCARMICRGEAVSLSLSTCNFARHKLPRSFARGWSCAVSAGTSARLIIMTHRFSYNITPSLL